MRIIPEFEWQDNRRLIEASQKNKEIAGRRLGARERRKKTLQVEEVAKRTDNLSESSLGWNKIKRSQALSGDRSEEAGRSLRRNCSAWVLSRRLEANTGFCRQTKPTQTRKFAAFWENNGPDQQEVWEPSETLKYGLWSVIKKRWFQSKGVGNPREIEQKSF